MRRVRGFVGARKVATAIVGLVRRGLPEMRVEWVTCNSAPAVLVYSADRVDIVIAVDVVDGKIANFYAIRNPEKLVTAAVPRRITR